jgi:hypothetical protein
VAVDRLLESCVESGHVLLIPIWEVSVESLGISCSYEVDVPFGVSRVLVSLLPRSGALEFELFLGICMTCMQWWGASRIQFR